MCLGLLVGLVQLYLSSLAFYITNILLQLVNFFKKKWRMAQLLKKKKEEQIFKIMSERHVVSGDDPHVMKK